MKLLNTGGNFSKCDTHVNKQYVAKAGKIVEVSDGEGQWLLKNFPKHFKEIEENSGIVSVVITCHNYGKYLHQSINSVLNQTYKDVEIIVVNDGSTDDTKEILANYDIKVINFPKSHSSAYARNAGLKVATGDFIVFLDADDYLHSHFIEETMAVMDGGIGVVYASHKDLHESVARIPFLFFDKYKYGNMLMLNQVVNACLMRTKLVRQVGGYDTSLKRGEDYDMLLRLALITQFYRLNKELHTYRHHKTQKNREKSRAYYNKLTQDIQAKHAVDIIIPTYKNEKYTIACIKSIKKNTDIKPYKFPYRIVWVDNGSPESSRKKVRAALKNVNHKEILLKKNTGYVGAVNAGLKVSSAPTVCLLNNDTEVSNKWLYKMVNILYANPKLGILGCLTAPEELGCQAINHQKRNFPLPEWNDDINSYSDLLDKDFGGKWSQAKEMVGFYCVVIKRELIDKLGELDPDFGLGLYDDVDYCDKAMRAGYDIGFALDVCIFHNHRTTFELLKKEQNINYNKVMSENYLIFKKKREARA